jgi:hypothetical protein
MDRIVRLPFKQKKCLKFKVPKMPKVTDDNHFIRIQ